MSENFKTCVFGGFDKQDVVTYIEAQARKHTEEMDEAQRHHAEEMDDLRRKLIAMQEELNDASAECSALHDRADRAAAAEQALVQARQELSDLKARCEALQAENDRCKGPAAEYERMKDHIAEIEINAHRRTEEFRANAIEQLRSIAIRQREWCDREKQSFAAAQQELQEKLERSRQILESSADGIFDDMLSDLKDFEDNLQ